MRILTKEEVQREKVKVVRALRECLFIHPTDTIYGIGCNATERKLVHKLRAAKEQFVRPLSVIAPSLDWIRENCVVNENAEAWLEKLPGPYTIILKLKNLEAVSRNTHLGLNTLGVRMPDHWFTELVADLNIPVITTSANITGGNFMTGMENVNDNIKDAVEYVINEGDIEGKPSMVIDLTSKKEKVLRN